MNRCYCEKPEKAGTPTKILDTVALVGFINEGDPLHAASIKHVQALSNSKDAYVASAALFELDVVLKSNGVSCSERERIFDLLTEPIPKEKIVWVTPEILKQVAEWDGIAKWNSHYFDVMMAAIAQAHNAEVVTTDQQIPSLGVRTSW